MRCASFSLNDKNKAGKMIEHLLSRRDFLQATGASALVRLTAPVVASIAQAACTAREEQAAFRILNIDEAADFAAIAARIIPTTDTPGATEAGVIHFFDQAFANEMSEIFDSARTGLAELNQAIGDRHFSSLDEDEQDLALEDAYGDRFFAIMRIMTIFGFFAMSEYGGNKDHIGWDLIGFEGHHGAWQYPFGAYDAEVHDAPNVTATDGE